jgi:pilus assembly protein CpaB
MNRRVLAVVSALTLAAVGTAGVLYYVQTADTRAAAGQQAVTVLMVTERIATGTSGARIRSGKLAEQVKMPASSVPPGALSSVTSDLDDLVLTSDVQADQILLRGQFASSQRVTGGLALPKNTIAVSVAAQVPAEVAGFITPGADVAVFDTYTELSAHGRIPSGDGLSRGRDANQVTRLLLQRVEVIAIGERGSGAQTSSGGSAASDGSSDKQASSRPSNSVLVTVAVPQAAAERLIHGAQTGALYLALLSDTSTVTPGAGVDNYTLFK